MRRALEFRGPRPRVALDRNHKRIRIARREPGLVEGTCEVLCPRCGARVGVEEVHADEAECPICDAGLHASELLSVSGAEEVRKPGVPPPRA